MRQISMIGILLNGIIGLRTPPAILTLPIHKQAQPKIANLKLLRMNENIIRLKILMKNITLMQIVISINQIIEYF